MNETVRAAVLLSGSGRTLRNFLDKMAAGNLPLNIVGVVSNRPHVRGLAIAAEAGLAQAVYMRRDFADVASHNLAINRWLAPLHPEIVILAGYLSYYIPPKDFPGPVVNIHPALLPKFGGQGYYGDRVHQAVLDAGESETGCTVHRVDEVYDNGQILGQSAVAVNPDDDVATLAARVFAAECELYPQILRKLAEDIQAAR